MNGDESSSNVADFLVAQSHNFSEPLPDALLYAILRIRQASEKLIRPIHSGWSDAAVIYGRDHKLAKNDVKLHCHREVTILPRDAMLAR